MRKKELRKLLNGNINLTAPSFDQEKKKQLHFIEKPQVIKKPYRKSLPLAFAGSVLVLIVVVIGIKIIPQTLKDKNAEPQDQDELNGEALDEIFNLDYYFTNLNGKLSDENQIYENYLRDANSSLDLLLWEFRNYRSIYEKAADSESEPIGEGSFGSIKYNSNFYDFEIYSKNNFALKSRYPQAQKTLQVDKDKITLILETVIEKTYFIFEDSVIKILKVCENKYQYLLITGDESFLYMIDDLEADTFLYYYYLNRNDFKVDPIYTTPLDTNKIREFINSTIN